MSKQALLIFIKNPELGKAKTRLAKTVGNEKALRIYKELLRHTRDLSLQVEATRLLFYSSFVDAEDEWNNAAFQKQLQTGKELGERMTNAFRAAFQAHEKVVIIGSDCAALTAQIIQTAFQALDTKDFVIGPAMDGGYYLLGMRQPDISVFENIAWSTDQVFPTTMKRIQALDKTYALLPELSDIDYWEDWLKYGWAVE